MVRRVGLGGAIIAGLASVVVWTIDPPARASTEPARTSAEPPGAMSGASLFHAKGCASCHAGPDSSPQFAQFPSLRDASSWAADRIPEVDARGYLAQSISDPSAFISPNYVAGGPTDGMPELVLSDTEIESLVDYLLRG